MIKGNIGLIGFVIEFGFDQVLTPVGESSCHVDWYGTSDMKEDGHLFTVKFKVGDPGIMDKMDFWTSCVSQYMRGVFSTVVIESLLAGWGCRKIGSP